VKHAVLRDLHRATVDELGVAVGVLTDITAFEQPSMFTAFGPPASL
jgi:hypothetical protein